MLSIRKNSAKKLKEKKKKERKKLEQELRQTLYLLQDTFQGSKTG